MQDVSSVWSRPVSQDAGLARQQCPAMQYDGSRVGFVFSYSSLKHCKRDCMCMRS